MCRLQNYGVALVTSIDKIVGLFCKRDLQKRQYSAKETYYFIDAIDRSHPIGHMSWNGTRIYKYIYIHEYIQECIHEYINTTNPTWGVIFESSKLERLFCHVSVKRDVRALSFEL